MMLLTAGCNNQTINNSGLHGALRKKTTTFIVFLDHKEELHLF